MRKFALVFSLLVALAANVQAGSILPLSGGQNDFRYIDKEITIKGAGNTGAFLQTGDQVLGVLEVAQVNGSTVFAPQLLGIFDLQVQTILLDPTANFGFGGARVYFGAGTLLQTIDPTIPANTLLALYTNASTAPYDAATPSAAGVSGIATTGTPFAAFGFPNGGFPGGGGTISTGYDVSDGASALTTTTVPLIPPVGSAVAFGMFRQTWPGSQLTNDIKQQTNPETTFSDGFKYDFVGKSSLSPETNAHDILQGWTTASSDPAHLNVVTPEPGAIVIWSLGALGLCIPAVRRRLKIGK
jgi:hypothetical protein